MKKGSVHMIGLARRGMRLHKCEKGILCTLDGGSSRNFLYHILITTAKHRI